MKIKNNLKKWLLAIVAFLVALVFCLWPTQYVIDSPGTADQISQYIKTSAGKPNPNLYLVTVAERPAVMIDYLTSYLRPFDTRYTQKEVMGDSSGAEYNQMQKYYMENSQNNAIYYAAKKAKVPYNKKYLGVYVMSIMPNSNFRNKLKIGDTVEKVNGKHFTSTQKLISYIAGLKKNTKIIVTILRKNKRLTFSGKTITIPDTKRSGIGISLVDHTEVETKPAIKIDAGDIGGPSAGLMFSLECYQIFSKQNLAKNKIAGTGTIDENGKVGIIGGVDKKVVAADKKKMKVFFAPTDQPAGISKADTNYEQAVKTAKKIHSKMKIVPVANFEDALEYLQKN